MHEYASRSIAIATGGGAMQYTPVEALIYLGSEDIDADVRKVESLDGTDAGRSAPGRPPSRGRTG